MVKKISGSKKLGGRERKQLQSKRLKLKSLHRDVAAERAELMQKPADELPPASASNAARQVRSKLNNTFPVNWQELHLKGPAADDEEPEAGRPEDQG